MIIGMSLNLTFLGEGSESEARLSNCSRISVLMSTRIRDLLTPFSEFAIGGTSESRDESDQFPLVP